MVHWDLAGCITVDLQKLFPETAQGDLISQRPKA